MVIEPAFVTATPFSSTPGTLLIATPVFPVGTVVVVPLIITEVTLVVFSSLVNNAPSTGVSFGVWLMSFSVFTAVLHSGL